MTRGWAKSLLFSICITIFVFSFLLMCIGIGCASASNPQIVVTPPEPEVKVLFDSKRHSEDFYTAEETITITNNGKNATVVSISHDPKIVPSSDNFPLDPGEFKVITIKASWDADEISYYLEIKAEEVTVATVTVKIIHCAKIVVSPSSINFRGEKIGSKKSKESETITISEVYGYKDVKGIEIKKISGNPWVTIKDDPPNQIDKDSFAEIKFQITSEKDPIIKNEYSWDYKITTTTSHTEISPDSITIEAYILMPPKLGKLHDGDLEIKFDEPKGTVRKYDRYIDVRVRNEGDETMDFNSWLTEYPREIEIEIVNPSGSVSGKSSANIELHVIAPYDAPEGTYHGRLYIDAGGAGHGDVDITIVIIWPVDFTVSSTSPYFTTSPPSIDFGTIELKERGYKKKSANITLTEVYLYKPVRNLRFSKSGEYGKWLKEETDFYEIPPGESRNITLKIESGLEAVPKDYSWKYDISAYEIGAKRMEVKAKIVPINITKMIESFRLFRGTQLYKSYPSSEVIISNGVEMLEVVEGSEIDADDWKKIPVLTKGALSLISSLNDGIISSEEENYGKAVENLLSASVSASTVGSNSELNNWDISGYAKDISTGADRTTEEVLIDEAKMLEGRGWDIKKAVEHAMAMGDISRLKKEENVLESALSYQYAATIYGLLNDKEKKLECVYEESLLMDKHDELASDATHFRIEADKNIMNSRENDLIRIWNTHLLLNPYKYDTFSESYGLAEKYLEDALKNYKVAGESHMSEDTEKKLKEVKSEWSYILSLFFIACILYGAAFIYTINRVIMGTVAYMRDMYEREVGDIIVE